MAGDRVGVGQWKKGGSTKVISSSRDAPATGLDLVLLGRFVLP